MSRPDLLRTYFLRFTFLILGLLSIGPFTYFVANYSNVPFHWLMPALFISACVLPIIDFHNNKRASLLRFILRVLLTAIVVFGIFPNISIWVRATTAVYMLVFLSILSYVITDKFHNVGALCFIMFTFNLFTAFILQRSPFMAEHGQPFSILVVISTFAILSFFIIQNIDSSRQFGVDIVKIPSATKRVLLVILAVFCILVILLTLMPWIIEALDTMFSFIRNLLSQLANLLIFTLEPQPGQISEIPDLPPLFDDNGSLSEPDTIHPIIIWLSTALFILTMLTLIIIALVMIALMIIRLFKIDQRRKIASIEVYTETIEKVFPKRKKRNLARRPRYSSLLTERDRVLFIYNEYVRRAKRTGLTRNNLSDTPKEVLNEITQNIAENNFPPPENLTPVFNKVKYSSIGTEITGADELKQRLL